MQLPPISFSFFFSFHLHLQLEILKVFFFFFVLRRGNCTIQILIYIFLESDICIQNEIACFGDIMAKLKSKKENFGGFRTELRWNFRADPFCNLIFIKLLHDLSHNFQISKILYF